MLLGNTGKGFIFVILPTINNIISIGRTTNGDNICSKTSKIGDVMYIG